MYLEADYVKLRIPEDDAALARLQAHGDNLSWDYEEACLGAALIDNSILDGPLAGLVPEDFSDPGHAELLVVMRLLYAKHGFFDTRTLAEILARHDRLRTNGGRAYLRKLLRRGEKSLGTMAPSAQLLMRMGRVRRETEAAQDQRSKSEKEGSATADANAAASEGFNVSKFQGFNDQAVSEADVPSSGQRSPTWDVERETGNDVSPSGQGPTTKVQRLPYSGQGPTTKVQRQSLSLAEIDAVPIEWLWNPYLALGTVALLSGEPGCGTTYLALAIAAAITKGKTPLIDSEGFKVSKFQGFNDQAVSEADVPSSEQRSPTWNVERGTILRRATGDGRPGTAFRAGDGGRATGDGPPAIYLGTDSPARVIRPRFDHLGGDARRLHLLPSATPASRSAAVNRQRTGGSAYAKAEGTLQTLLESLEAALRATGAKLVIVDSLQSFVGTGPGRLPLDELRRLAEEYNCCVLLVRHVNRARSGRVRVRTMSGLDLVGATSTELLAGISPYDPERRSLVPVRSNVGPLGPAWGYAITEDGAFESTGPSELDADGILAPALRPEHRSAFEEAVSFLQEALAKGAVRANELQQRARKQHISQASLQRAKARLGVVSSKVEGCGLWYWNLPGNEGEWADPVLEDLVERPEIMLFIDQLEKVEATGFFVKFAHLATIEQVEKVDDLPWVRDESRRDYPKLLRRQFNQLMCAAGKVPQWEDDGPCGTFPHTLEDLENLGVTLEDAVLLVDLKKQFDYPLDEGCKDCLVSRYDENRLHEIMKKLLGKKEPPEVMQSA
jgi:hypothetical protein